MIEKTVTGVTAFVLLSIVALGVVSASPNTQTSVRSASFQFLITVLMDADDKGVPSDGINELLAGLFIEYLITPHTGETVGQAGERLSAEGQPNFQFLVAVLTDAYDKGVLSDEINELLADLFIEYLIMPVTGETKDQVRTRLSAQPTPTATTTPTNDRVALTALYKATDGPNWADNTNWLTDEPLSEWHGVTTDDDGRVTGLSLLGNKLSGSIPPELGNLASLTWLWLFGNQLSGSIPSELGSLTNLTWLNLGNNRLAGEIPSELGNLTKLKTLDFGNNQLTGEIPSELGNLTKLERLLIAENYISGIMPLSEMTKLRVVRLHTNSISDLAPLAANTGLGTGAVIDVRINPLSDASRDTHIPDLQARGVTVRYSPSHVNTDTSQSDSGRYIENADGSIRIEYFFTPRPGEKQRDLARAQRTVDFLVELFGNRPSEPIVYEMTGRIRGDESRSWTRFRPQVTVPFEFQYDPLQVHEVAHVFTYYLLPTDEWWFNEGISIQAEAIDDQFNEGIIGGMSQYRYSNTHNDCLTPQVAPALARLKAGENVFVDYPARVEICEIHWLNVHNTGQLFFMGLEDYGMYGTKVQEFLGSLDRLAEGDERIGIEEIKQAAHEVLGEDISPLLDLLEPGIVFNDSVRYQEDLERVKEFFDQHPEYATPHVSWID